MRRLLSASLVLAMALALPTSAFADEPDETEESTTSAPESVEEPAEDLDELLWQPETDAEGTVPTQRHGFVDPGQVLEEYEAEPTVVEGQRTLPAPQPGAEAYPVPANNVYDIVGGGFGHRIGMSQYGAHGAGQQGLSHAQILAFYYPGTRLDTNSYGTMRIGLTVDNDGVTRVNARPGLRVTGSNNVAHPLPTNRDQWRVRATSSSASSCVLEGRVNGTWSPWWPSGTPRQCPLTFSNPQENTVDLWLPGDTRRVYRGTITATHTGSSALVSVNRVSMQLYLRSVVSAEMPSSFHQQALRTQAVAARTYAARGAGGNAHYDTCDTTWCQVYKGRGVRNSDGSITSLEYSTSVTAVDATAGQVLTYPFANGRGLATTMYSSSTGGHTMPGGAGHGYLVAKPDPYDAVANNARYRWPNAKLPATSLESRYGIHDVRRVQVLSRDGHGEWGGRVVDARVEGFTSSGAYTWAYATGTGLSLARSWPTYADGLSTDYFTFGGGSAPPAEVGRLGGADRYRTAEQVSRRWSSGVGVVYVASGETYADALTASARAGVYDAPVLLVRPDRVPAGTRDALTRLRPGRMVVVGGSTAINEATLRALRGYTTSGDVQRVQGGDRYATAAAMASFYAPGQSTVVLASGENFPDALAGAALAGHRQVPLLLTRQGRLDSATTAQLRRLRPGNVTVLGGGAVISSGVAREAASYSTSKGWVRLWGEGRYDTSEAVAAQFPRDRNAGFVASGDAFPDALVGAALAGRLGTPLVLTQPDRVPSATARALGRVNARALDVVGGTTAVTEGTRRALSEYLR